MKVFTNTTPLIALASVSQLNLLPLLFTQVHTVESVREECEEGGPIFVPPLNSLDWLKVIPRKEQVLGAIPPLLSELGKGERDTLIVALESKADLVIIDERMGRNVAEYFGLRVIGTLGILLKAKKQGLIDSFVSVALDMLKVGIRYHPKLIQKLAIEVGESCEL